MKAGKGMDDLHQGDKEGPGKNKVGQCRVLDGHGAQGEARSLSFFFSLFFWLLFLPLLKFSIRGNRYR